MCLQDIVGGQFWPMSIRSRRKQNFMMVGHGYEAHMLAECAILGLELGSGEC